MSNTLIITGASIYTDGGFIEEGFIIIENNEIKSIGKKDEWKKLQLKDFQVIQFDNSFNVVPGFIDIHIHGAGGSDAMDGTKEALDTISQTLPEEGTTSFLATTMTQSKKAIEQAVENAGQYAEYHRSPGQAEILGIHLEGPFISSEKAGAQPEKHIILPDLSLFKEWQKLAKNRIKLVTLAAEKDESHQLISYLMEHGIIASIGHSNATYQQTEEAIQSGVSHATHLFNQMSGLHHREPGIVGAVYNKSEMMAELIVDGIHVNREVIRLTYSIKGKEGLILITDAIRAKGLSEGTYDLGGQDVEVKDGKASLSDGTLAGSILTMNQAVKNMLAYTDASLEDVIEMAAANPAKRLNIYDRKGSLAVGKDADIVVLDSGCNVVLTICCGEIAYQSKEGR